MTIVLRQHVLNQSAHPYNAEVNIKNDSYGGRFRQKILISLPVFVLDHKILKNGKIQRAVIFKYILSYSIQYVMLTLKFWVFDPAFHAGCRSSFSGYDKDDELSSAVQYMNNLYSRNMKTGEPSIVDDFMYGSNVAASGVSIRLGTC